MRHLWHLFLCNLLGHDPNEVPKTPAECEVPPPDWHCIRKKGHEGPCGAVGKRVCRRCGAESRYDPEEGWRWW